MDAVRCASLSPDKGEIHDIPLSNFRLIDLGQCLALACISESTFYRLVKDGRMPAPAKIGRANRWVESEVVAAYQCLVRGGVQ